MAGQLVLIEGVPAASETEGQDVGINLLLRIAAGLVAWTYIVFSLGVCAGRCSKNSKSKSQARRTYASPVREGSYRDRVAKVIHG